MDWKNKTDKELVEDNDIGARGLNALVEMMRRLKNSMNVSSWVMIILNIILLILTMVLIRQGFK